MRILLLGLNYAPEPIGAGHYTAGLVAALVARGHEVRVVAGVPHYPQWRPSPGYAGWSCRSEGGATVFRVPHYIPLRPSGPRRLLHQLSFALAALPVMVWNALVFRPHRVITIAPSLLSAPIGHLAARLCGARSWLHVQDFELEAALATGLVSGNRTLAAFLGWIERSVLRAFDQVSSISPAMCRRLAAKGVGEERISEHRNWADRGTVVHASSYRQKWGIETPHVALYAGAECCLAHEAPPGKAKIAAGEIGVDPGLMGRKPAVCRDAQTVHAEPGHQ